MWIGSDLKPLKDSQTCRSERKERTQRQSDGANPRLVRMATMRSMLILSKNPCMSKRITDAISLDFTAAWALCTKHMVASTALW